MSLKNKNFVSPFSVSYEEFLKAIPEKTSVKDYCKGNLTDEEIEWIETEIENYKNNLKNK